MSMARILVSSFALTALVFGCKGPAPETATTNTSTTTATTSSTTTSTAPPAFPFIPPVQISGNISTTVPFPSNAPPNATSEQARPFFDWFSWESFIALNWPASGTGRGNPNQPNNPSVFTGMTNTTPVTWGTYKANWELFDQYNK